MLLIKLKASYSFINSGWWCCWLSMSEKEKNNIADAVDSRQRLSRPHKIQ